MKKLLIAAATILLTSCATTVKVTEQATQTKSTPFNIPENTVSFIPVFRVDMEGQIWIYVTVKHKYVKVMLEQ